MNIVAHRGLWNQSAAKNSAAAMEAAFANGFGVETDIRDFCGELVVSHDIAVSMELTLAKLLALHRDWDRNLPLALNVKADGLAAALQKLLRTFEVPEYFAFDMSVPELIRYRAAGIRYMTRLSEIERSPLLIEESLGIWWDQFQSTWYDVADFRKYLAEGKQIAIVSPELHGRDALPLWDALRRCYRPYYAGLLLCTDRPLEARAFFNQ